jgi:hypothetical protein
VTDLFLLPVLSCTADVLNGTDLQGRTVYCSAPVSIRARSPVEVFQTALHFIKIAKGSGLIFAQFTVDLLEITSSCQGIPCVLVDFGTGKQILKYIAEDRYGASQSTQHCKIEAPD